MPRGPLTDAQKAKMQQARKATGKQRDAALSALEANSQFTNPKFWAQVAPEFQDEVVKAIRKSQRQVKKAEIARLQAKIEQLASSL